ncbi:Uncharacterised protein [Actinomyces bovis]|uniref:N-acetyltransferase domain-containing protein n=1 Tax=Actinomyces bovis TaxID=1658 RepID=A0ABY1VPU2_9ACTO|nr:hypothetical protein [Actinomyces bovis]SPT54134.1 Uncharacterised protein [Actinomyces bovis]VEG53620.1 Uncharacterised protein [Actinomyces israelii]
MPWWEVIGWAGSVLVVVSLMVPSVRRFRLLNLSGSLIATVYNVVFMIWPYAAMNAVIAVIDAYWLIRLRQSGERHYSVCAVEPGSALVTRFVERHGAGISKAFPGFEGATLEGARSFVTLCDDEIIGLFAYQQQGTVGQILLDYVTDRFRDLKPGRTLYADPAIRKSGIESLVVAQSAVHDRHYFERQGFTATDGELRRAWATV